MKSDYEIVIIGAGPAGASCAVELQKNGLKPCLIDKAVFPRNKTCAGLVTAKTYELLSELLPNRDLNGLFCDKTNEIALFEKQDELVRTTLSDSVRLVKRRHFDNTLVEEYKSLGGYIREGEKAVGIDYDKNEVKLQSGETIKYKNLIIADGALSSAHGELDFNRKKLAFGVETYVPRDLIDTKAVELYFGYLKSGYVWIFPHGETVCIGVCDIYKKDENYKTVLSAFLKDKNINPDDCRYTGAFLPYGGIVPQKYLPDNVMLIGDAGGFADPISGEGLFMALKTGITAAKSLKTSEPKNTYLNEIKPLINTVKEGKKVQTVFYSSVVYKKIMKKLRGKTKLVGWFFENQVEHYNYRYKHIKQLHTDYKKQNK